MKRDLGLCRQILLQLESHCDPYGTPAKIEVSGFTADQIGYNTSLLIQAGLVDEWGANSRSMNNQYECYAANLTWEGHEFLDIARNDNVWKSASEKITKKLASISFEMLKIILVDIATDIL